MQSFKMLKYTDDQTCSLSVLSRSSIKEAVVTAIISFTVTLHDRSTWKTWRWVLHVFGATQIWLIPGFVK